MTLEGIDNSVFNTSDPHLTNLAFVFSRAVYGTSPDRRYGQHATWARANGCVQGAYAFGVHGNVDGQVRAFLTVGGSANLLALDLESNGANTMTHDEGALFIRLVHARGRKIGLYHSLSGFPHLGQDFDWPARWGAPPPGHWDFWQYAGAPLDRDRYNGTMAGLRTLAGLAPVAKYAVSVHPLEGFRGYPDHRYFNVFTVDGSTITAVSTGRTGGFSATCSPPRTFSWPGHKSQSLVRLTSGSRAGTWIRAAYSHVVSL